VATLACERNSFPGINLRRIPPLPLGFKAAMATPLVFDLSQILVSEGV
jgi:hypothetical protein